MKHAVVLITLSVALGLALAPAAEAQNGAFALIPKPGTDSRELARALQHRAIQKHAPLFSASERQALIELGEDALARAEHLHFATEADYRSFSEELSARGWKLGLEPTELPVQLNAIDKTEPLQPEQWGLINTGAPLTTAVDDITSIVLPAKAGEDIGLLGAPPEKENASKVIVAVLDTGIDATHPDLTSNIVRKPEECEALENYRLCLKGADKRACDQKWAAFDSDQNGYPMDCQGWNLTVGKNPLNGIQGNSQTADTVGHGTHVAGVIGAALNGMGVHGVSRNVSLLPVKIFNANPRSPVRAQTVSTEPVPEPSENGRSWDTGFADILARGVLYAIRSGARVMNISLAWPASADSELMRRMIRLAQERGILIVAAAGNDSTEAEVMPCAYPGVVCVASHQPDGSLSHFSNHGASVDVAAPGVKILSTWPMSLRATSFTELAGYEFKNGTSMAAPFVTGALARLLAAGYSAEEAFARVLAGARPASAQSRDVRFGNLDLARSFEIPPEPLIVPAQKEMLEISWDRAERQLSRAVPLRNIWQEAKKVDIAVRLPPELARSLELVEKEFHLDDWKSGEIRSLPLSLRVLNDTFPSEIDLWLEVRAPRVRSFKVRIAVSVPVQAAASDPEMEVIPLAARVAPSAKLRTILSTGTSESSAVMRDYAILEGSSLQILGRTDRNGNEEGAYDLVGRLRRDAQDGELLAIYRLDWDRAGEDEYALLSTLSDTPGKTGSKFKLAIFKRETPELKRAFELTYDATRAIIPETFSWLTVGTHLFPAWIGGGYTPESEIPAYDPWNPDWSDSPRSRFYYLDAAGLHTLAEPAGYLFVSVLSQTAEQKRNGTLAILLAKGDSYRMTYATALVRTLPGKDRPELTDLRILALPAYRMLLGYDSTQPVWSLDGGASSAGSAFSLSGRPGTLRTTILEYGSPATGISGISDILSTPQFDSDAVLRSAAAFSGPGGGLFTQTQYDLQFQDRDGRQIALTSLRRFSFLPQLSFLRSFLPAIVHSRDASLPRAPAILIEGSPSGKDVAEAIFPEYDPSGTLVRLSQPARLRLTAGPGCQRIPNPIAPTASSPTQIVFFCGDRFIRVPLTR